MTTELGLSSVSKEPGEHQSDDSKVEEPHAQYISAVVEAICRNQLATLKQWLLYLENLPRFKREAIWTTCKTLPSFSNFNRNSFVQTINTWEENPVRNMSSISVLYTAICFLQTEGMLPEIPPKGEPNYEYNPSTAKDFQSPTRDTTIPPPKQQYVQQSPVTNYQMQPQPQMTQYITPNYATPPVYQQMPQQYMQNPQMHFQDPSQQMHLPNVPMMQMQPLQMNPNGMQPPTLPMPGMYPQQNMNPYMMQQQAYNQPQMIPQAPPNMQGHALGACPGCRQVLKYPQAATIVRCPKCNTTLQPQQLQQQLQQQFPQHQVQMLHQQLQSGTLQVQPQQQLMQTPYTQQNNSPRHITPNSSKNNNKVNPYQQPLQQPLQTLQPLHPQQMQPHHQMQPLTQPQQHPPQQQQQGHSSVNSLLNAPVMTPSSFMPMGNQNQMTVNPLSIQMKSSMSSNQILSPSDFGQKLPLPKPSSWNGSNSPSRSYSDQSMPPSLSPILNPRQAVTHEIALEGPKLAHPRPLLDKEQFAKKFRPDFPPSPQSQDHNAGYHSMETVSVPLGSSQDRPILLEEPANDRVKEEYNYEQNAQQQHVNNVQPEQQTEQPPPQESSEKDSMVQSFFSESTEVQQ